MNRLMAFGSAALLSLGVAAAPASAQSAGHILRGAGIGAAGGAVAGALIPGLSVGEGALIGGAGGAIVNTIDKGHHRSYRHDRKYRGRYYNRRRYR
ncbi:hypothetical protein [Sphingomonas profundi]|uniref:hypothetical protein n=1 Tax=Alterirhizorhabdus profundi TaxID=2681549 RepID=UPI0012E80DB2|nr:hypothetical protein [Sphingomonas profundi]